MDVAEFGMHWTEQWMSWKQRALPGPKKIQRIGKELLAASATGAWIRVVFGGGVFVEQACIAPSEEALLGLCDQLGGLFQHPYFLKFRMNPGVRNIMNANSNELGFQVWCSHPADVAVLGLLWFDRIQSTREFVGVKFEEAVHEMFKNPWALPVRS